jgi:hypothetical protein
VVEDGGGCGGEIRIFVQLAAFQTAATDAFVLGHPSVWGPKQKICISNTLERDTNWRKSVNKSRNERRMLACDRFSRQWNAAGDFNERNVTVPHAICSFFMG